MPILAPLIAATIGLFMAASTQSSPEIRPGLCAYDMRVMVSHKDAMTPATERQILKANTWWKDHCK